MYFQGSVDGAQEHFNSLAGKTLSSSCFVLS